MREVPPGATLTVAVAVTSCRPPSGPGSAVADVKGGVLSMLMGANDACVAAFPARSEQSPPAAWLAPSPLLVTGGVRLAASTPEAAALPPDGSVQLNVIVTSWLVQAPGRYGRPSAVIAAGVRIGAVLSILTPARGLAAVLPATSVQTPVAAWSAPSVEIVTETRCDRAPDSASEQAQLSVTSVLFHP